VSKFVSVRGERRAPRWLKGLEMRRCPPSSGHEVRSLAGVKSHLNEHLRSVRRGHPLMCGFATRPNRADRALPNGAVSRFQRQPMPGSRKPKISRPSAPLKLRRDPWPSCFDDGISGNGRRLGTDATWIEPHLEDFQRAHHGGHERGQGCRLSADCGHSMK